MTETSLFTKIIRREIPADILFEDEQCIVIKDIQPQAPIHLLLIPKVAIPRLVDAQAEHQALLGHLMITAGRIATDLGCGDAFRLIVNNGEGAGQTVFHLHLHLLSGKTLSEQTLSFN